MKKKPATKTPKDSNAKSAGKKQARKSGERAKAKQHSKPELKKPKRGTLTVEREESVDLQEVSGICLRRAGRGEMWLIAIGDRDAQLARARLSGRQSQELSWEYIDISALPGSKIPSTDPQIEAVCADGTGRVLLLQESPPRAELVDLTDGNTGVVASFDLAIGEPFEELAEAWVHPEGSRGEGVVLLPNGHLLVAKEKKPAALLEFGPPNATPMGMAKSGALRSGERWQVAPGDHEYVALAAWLPNAALAKACEDFSDLEIGPDGHLYVLSDQSRTVAWLNELSPGSDLGVASPAAVWDLDEVDGKPEGLSFTPQGQAVIALDKRKAKKNLLLMTPAIAGGKASG